MQQKNTKKNILQDIKVLSQKYFFSSPSLVQKLPSKKLWITIDKDENILLNEQKSQPTNQITFNSQEQFFPVLVHVGQEKIVAIASKFNLYANINPEPFKTAQAEFQFQQNLILLFNLVGGESYYRPGDARNFVHAKNFDRVLSENLELRYEHDESYFYLFVLIEKNLHL